MNPHQPRSLLIYAQFALAVVLAGISAPTQISAQKSEALPVSTLTYADLADLALAAPIVAEVRATRAEQLSGKLAPGLGTGKRRSLLQADVMAVIRGTGGLPPRISYLVDLPPGANGRWEKLRKRSFIVFARSSAAKPGTIQLIAADAQQPLTPGTAARVREILREATAEGAPPAITGVGDAFHVAGTRGGEGETQIFLKAADGRPLSLSIWRSPGASPRWAVSTGEIVDEGAAPPARDTLLWYRLACSLPSRLPPMSTASLDPALAAIASEDYATVIAGLGACQRSRETRSRG